MTLEYLKRNSLELFVRFAPAYMTLTFLLNMIANPNYVILSILSGLILLLIGLVFCIWLIHLIVYGAERKRKHKYLLLYSLGFIVLLLSFMYVVMPTIAPFRYWGMVDFPDKEAIAKIILRYINMLMISGFIFYHIKSKYQQEEREKDRESAHQRELEYKDELHKMEIEAKDLEYAFLSAQMNPHFLHNSLSTIADECDADNPAMAEQLWNLSGLMHYKLQSTLKENNIMPEVCEMEALNQYLDIMRWRFPNVDIVMETRGEEWQQVIMPTVLLALVENMFKHGRVRYGDYPIIILRELDKDYIQYRLCNKVDPQSERREASGVGLKNIKRRLDILFPDRYQLTYHVDEDNYFHVFLRINQN